MTLRIAIADDQSADLRLAANIVRNAAVERNAECEMRLYAYSGELLWDIEEGAQFDLYLLDIEMPPPDGFALARAVSVRKAAGHVVFLTCHPEYSLRGYNYNIWRYILKQDMKNLLPQLLDLILKEKENQHLTGAAITLQTGQGAVHIQPDSIYWLHKAEKHTYLHTSSGVYSVHRPLGTVLNELNFPHLLRVEKAFAVNCREVQQVDTGRIVLRDGTEIPFARKRTKEMKQFFLDYWEKNG